MIYAFNSLHYLINFQLELGVRGKVFIQNFKIKRLHNTIIFNVVWTTTKKIYFKYYKLKFLSIKSHKPNLQTLNQKKKKISILANTNISKRVKEAVNNCKNDIAWDIDHIIMLHCTDYNIKCALFILFFIFVL